MSVCVEGLIRNDFYSYENIDAVEAELNRASQILNDYFHLEGEDRFLPEGLDCGDYQVYSQSYRMPTLYLRKGYWHVSPAYRYHQLFTPPLFVRKGFYDIAKALGKSEVWYCDEFRLDNSGDLNWNYDSPSFEEWLKYINSTYGPIKEFPIEEIMLNEEIWPNVEPVYHDCFKEIKCNLC